jgi:hypothetical protein
VGVGADTRLVVFSLGGIEHPIDLTPWSRNPDIHWIVPKALLPDRLDMTAQEDLPFHFTDLLASADALIAKPGYGNFTEAACNGTPVLYVPRPDWPEQPYLLNWMSRYGMALALSPECLPTGDLQMSLAELWTLPQRKPVVPEGARVGAGMLANYF